MTDDIVARLREEGFITHMARLPRESKLLHEAADEIERLRVELARYKRMYARACCRDLYSAGAKWKIRPNPMRDDGVFIEEDCGPSKRRTYFPFPCQFEQDVAEEIVELLNRATDEMESTDAR